MANEPSVHFQNHFRNDFEMLYQQRESRLWQCVRTEDQNVESDFYNFIGDLDDDDTETTVRHGDTELSEVSHLRRRLTLACKDKAVGLDRNDKAMMGEYDPSSGYAKTLSAYFGRWVDRKILAAMGGPAYTGQSGATTVLNYAVGECRLMNSDGTLATAGSDFSAKTETGLTLAKIETAGAVLTDAGVPEDDQRFLALDIYAVNALMTDTTWGSEEWRALRDVREGKMARVLGFNLKVLPRKQFTDPEVEGTACIQTYAWHRSAVLAASGTGLWAPRVIVGPRSDKKHLTQIFCDMNMGATRLQGPGVVEILLKQD